MKVSIVIPTYNTGTRVSRIATWLSAQSMPKHDYEVIFVDDGSTDDTVHHLRTTFGSWPNARILEIANSGWPSRPRNVGIQNATGEYIVFVDHDDELYPNGLRRAYEYASLAESDVLNAKESNSIVASWAMDLYATNDEDVSARSSPHPLAPMNPHKLYRREFLIEKDIRFREGRRVLYEDNLFNISCLGHHPKISVLADTPFYHWVRNGEETGTSSFRQDADEYWGALRGVLEHAENMLGAPDQAEKLAIMRLYQHRLRFAGYFKRGWNKKSPDRIEQDLAHIKAIVRDHLPEDLDARLPTPLRAKMFLFRTGNLAALEQLSEWDQTLIGQNELLAAEPNSAGELELDIRTVWRDGEGNGPRAIPKAGRLIRELPDDLRSSLPSELLDISSDVDAIDVRAGLRDDVSYVTWCLPTENQTIETGAGRAGNDVVVRTRARVDIRSAAGGHMLDDAVWSINAFTSLFEQRQQRQAKTSLRSRPIASPISPAVLHVRKKRALLDTRPSAMQGYLDSVITGATARKQNSYWETTITFARSGVADRVLLGVARRNFATTKIVQMAKNRVVMRRILRLVSGAGWHPILDSEANPTIQFRSRLSPRDRNVIVFVDGVPKITDVVVQ